MLVQGREAAAINGSPAKCRTLSVACTSVLVFLALGCRPTDADEAHRERAGSGLAQLDSAEVVEIAVVAVNTYDSTVIDLPLTVVRYENADCGIIVDLVPDPPPGMAGGGGGGVVCVDQNGKAHVRTRHS